MRNKLTRLQRYIVGLSVMWPSAIALSRWIAINANSCVRNQNVLELGAGCGLCGIAAAHPRIGNAKSVILTDFNRTVVENLEYNIKLNAVEDVATAVRLDFYDQSGRSSCGWIGGECGGRRDRASVLERGEREAKGKAATSELPTSDEGQDVSGHCDAPRRPQVDLVVGADIICTRSDAVASANAVRDCLRSGGAAAVICGSSDHRFGVEYFERACIDCGMEVTVHDVDTMYDGYLMRDADGLNHTSGFVEGMKLLFFDIRKKKVFETQDETLGT
mmetsp:Transcript_41710/g.97651  ORF Transcript_41710/g.97651 Transcript_41710/m.97651 type:complete len:275 (-) Transcript_41710:2879-3703(-)